MKISARNILEAKVKKITTGSVNSGWSSSSREARRQEDLPEVTWRGGIRRPL